MSILFYFIQKYAAHLHHVQVKNFSSLTYYVTLFLRLFCVPFKINQFTDYSFN